MILRPASVSLSPPLPRSLLPPSPLRCATPTIYSPRRPISAPPPRRPFSHTSHLKQSPGNAAAFTNHYEVLKVPMHANQAELKRQFYVLSKETHPDINRQDPKASERFAQISESYSVLADPEKRKRYDRDVMREHQLQHRQRGHHSAGRTGSYAGSRPASGLSKRRSVFKGPPPSFYAHGGSSTAQTRTQQQTASGQQDPYAPGGTFNPHAYSDDPAAPFDSRPTLRTQTHQDYRRNTRRQAELAAAQEEIADDNFWGRFVAVTGIIVVTVSLGTMIIKVASPPPGGGLTRADGSRRDGTMRNEWTKG